MPPIKSKYWKYFEKKKDSAVCRECNCIIKTSGNTTNLKYHLQKNHPGILSHQAEEEIENEAGPSEKKIKLQKPLDKFVVFSKVSEEEECTPHSSISKHQTTLTQATIKKTFENITSYIAGGSSADRLITAIEYMICVDVQPLSFVENKGFLKLLKIACPHFQPPSRKTIGRVIDLKYETFSSFLKNSFEKVTYITLTTDVWTDTNQCRSFLGVTGHYLEQNTVKSHTFDILELSENHTAEYLKSMFNVICEKWGISKEKISAVVTDNAANITKAVELCFGDSKHLPCFAHTLNLFASRPIQKNEELGMIIKKVKSIVTYFKQSVKAADELRKKSNDSVKLIQEVPTRWNSMFYMIERFLANKSIINEILLLQITAPIMITAKEISILEEVIELLKPIEMASKEISGEKYVTSSKIIPLTHLILGKIEKITPKTDIVQKLKEDLILEHKKRFKNVEHSHILAASCLLDPRFKKLHFKDPLVVSTTILRLRNEIQQLSFAEESDTSESSDSRKSTGEKSPDLWVEHQSMVQKDWQRRKKLKESKDDEISIYLKSPLGRLGDDPLAIWQETAISFPNLYKLATKYLGIVGTSVPSERLFSKAGEIMSEKRNRLKPAKLSKLSFLKDIEERDWFK